MRTNEIRFVKIGDPIAVRFDFKAGADLDGVYQEAKTVWFPAKVTAILEGKYPAIEGTTSAADGTIRTFHSGVIDQYSAETIARLPFGLIGGVV